MDRGPRRRARVDPGEPRLALRHEKRATWPRGRPGARPAASRFAQGLRPGRSRWTVGSLGDLDESGRGAYGARRPWA